MSVAIAGSSSPRFPLQLCPSPFEGPGTFELRERHLNLLTPKEYQAYGGGFRHSTKRRLNDGTAPHAHIEAILANRQRHPECWVPKSGRICPQCISESSTRCSVGWEIRLADACAVHGVWLVDRCKCGNPLSGHRLTLDRCDQCATKLGRLQTGPAPEALVRVTEELVRKAAGADGPTKKGLVAPLQALGFAEFHLLFRLLGVFADPSGPPVKLRSLQQFDPLAQSWRASTLGAEILDRWPVAFLEVLEWNRRFHDRGDTYSLQLTLGRLYRGIFMHLKDVVFDFVREELKTYLAANWRGQFTQSNRLRELSLLARRWITTEEAQDLLGVSPGAMRDFVDRGLLASDVRTTAAGRQKVLIARESVLDLAQTIQPAAQTLQTAARSLGLKRCRLARVAQSLFPHLWRSVSGEWRIPESDLRPFMDVSKFLERRSAADDEVTLRDVLRYRRLSDGTLVSWLLDVAGGTVRPVGFAEQATGVAGWLFERRYVEHRLSQARNTVRSSFQTLPEAAVRLHLKDEVIYQLANRGELETTPSWSVDSRGRLVSDKAIRQLQERYVPARDIADVAQTSPRHAAHLLGNVGVEPAIGPATGFRQVFYRRDEQLKAAVKKIWRVALPPWSSGDIAGGAVAQPHQGDLVLSLQ